MAKESESTAGTQKDEELLRGVLNVLVFDFNSINAAVDFNEQNPRKLALLLNTRSRSAHAIFYCVSLMRDPKLQLTSEKGRIRNLARLIEVVVGKQEVKAGEKKELEKIASEDRKASTPAEARMPRTLGKVRAREPGVPRR